MNTIERTHELDKLGTQFYQLIIAVDGALIAYAIKQVEGRELTSTLILCGLAVLCWAASFYYGVTSIRRLIGSRIIDIFRSGAKVKENAEFSEMAYQEYRKVAQQAIDFNKRMFSFLYAGGIFYTIWQLIEMWLKTFHKCG